MRRVTALARRAKITLAAKTRSAVLALTLFQLTMRTLHHDANLINSGLVTPELHKIMSMTKEFCKICQLEWWVAKLDLSSIKWTLKA